MLGLLLSAGAAAFAIDAHAGDAKDAPAAGAKDDGKGEASERFRAGVQFYKDHDYEAALVAFKRAYELDPNYRVLFNLGQASQELNDYASALKAFREYLEEGGAEIDKARRAKVDGFIAALTPKVGTITVTTSVPGAEISVDDAPVGTSPLDAPIIVNAGRRKFGATLKGYTPASRVEEIAGKDEIEVTLDLVAIETNTGPAKPDPRPPAPVVVADTTPVAAWVAFSLTAATGITAGIMGGLAIAARGSLDDELATYPGDGAAITSAGSKVKTFAITTDVLTGLAAAGAVTTLVLFLVAPGAPEDASKPDEAPKPETSFFVGPTGVLFQGTF